uniref:myosin regulatory light chain 2, atrial isoform-like n=1 Tax=Myxine glutinosa TaxID=7769 RepID=UPI00358FB4FB
MGKKETGKADFTEAQIKEFKDVFTIMDNNRDGVIDRSDLRQTFLAIGKTGVKDQELDEMLMEAHGPLNFEVFLDLFGSKLCGTDPEDVLLQAFQMFDHENKGSIKFEEFKVYLTKWAAKFSPEEVEQMVKTSPIRADGQLDYRSLCYTITHGDE